MFSFLGSSPDVATRKCEGEDDDQVRGHWSKRGRELLRQTCQRSKGVTGMCDTSDWAGLAPET